MKKEPISRNFNSPEEMAAHAEESYQINKKKVNQVELDAGLDISDPQSIMDFKINYTPLNAEVLLKEIPKEFIQEDPSKLLIMDLSPTSIKYYVMVPGLLVHTLKRGDIVVLKGATKDSPITAVTRILKDIIFQEVESYNIGGILKARDEIKKRIDEDDKFARITANQ